MSVLPDVPRLYTALAEILAALLYAQARPPRTAKPVYWGITAVWAILLAVFLHLTGHVPLAWWVPCMVTAIAAMYLYLWATREMNLREAGYSCARAFVLAELAASLEWQLHCWLWPQRGGGEIPALLLLAEPLEEIRDFLTQLADGGQLPAELFAPLVKTVGVALVSRTGSDLCRDAGEGAMASLVETAGAVIAILVSLPLFQAAWDMLRSLL